MNEEIMNAYFAGLIDGEGTLNIYPYKNGSCMRPVVKLNMTCEKTVRAAQSHFGGSVCIKRVYNGNKPQWHWCVTFNKAIEVIEKIAPYLITKKDAAYSVLQYKK